MQKIAELTDDEWSEDAFVWDKSCWSNFSTETRLLLLRQDSIQMPLKLIVQYWNRAKHLCGNEDHPQ